MRLVDNWKSAWKWFSVHCMTLAAAIQGGWASISDDMKQSIPHNLITFLTIGLLIMGVGGRIVKQDKDNVGNS